MIQKYLQKEYPQGNGNQGHRSGQYVGHPDLRLRLADLVIDVLLVLEHLAGCLSPQSHGASSSAWVAF